jgi:hypothetical protein
MAEIDELIAVYKASLDSVTEFEKAQLEKELWDVYCSSCVNGKLPGPRRDWFKSVMDEPQGRYEHRSLMLASGPWVLPFWKMYEAKIPHWTVFRLYHSAKQRAVELETSYEEASEHVIRAHPSKPVAAFSKLVPSSRTFPSGTDLLRAAGPPPAEEGPSFEPGPAARFDPSDSQSAKTRAFVSALNSLVDGYVAASLHGLPGDEDYLNKSVSDFLMFVEEASEDLRRRVGAYRVRSKNVVIAPVRVTRSQFRTACEVLGVTCSYGSPVDLKACKRMMMKRAARLHPDRNGGSHAAVSEYKAVIDSYDVLEKYAEGIRQEDGDSTHG